MFFEEEILMLLPVLTTGIPSALMSLGAYVLTAFSLYTIACRRGLQKPWLAWIPVVNCWIIGSLSDQYQYLVKGQDKSKRKVLLVLNVLQLVLTLTIAVMAGVTAAGVIFSGDHTRWMSSLMGPALAALGLCVPMLGIALAQMIIRYMAMYDIYRSSDPDNSVLYLVLSIVVGITEPFFLFFNRNKDAGMPPRKQPAAPQAQAWEAQQEKYL